LANWVHSLQTMRTSAVNKQRVQSIHPIDQPVENIMSYTECEAGICPVYVFLLNSRQKWSSLRFW